MVALEYMHLVLPRTLGALWGWVLSVFVVSIGLFTFRRSLPFLLSFELLSISIALLFIALRSVSSWNVRLFIACVITILLAFWRVEISHPPAASFHKTSVPTSGVASWFVSRREMLTRRIQRVFPRDDAALVAGVLYGGQGFSPQEKEAFRAAGIMHIVAVSGANVTILAQCLAAFCFVLGLRRRGVFVATSIALVAFVAFVGPSASVVRAAFMGWLLLLAPETGRRAHPPRSLIVSAAAMLLIDPWQLWNDAGFALSFLSMAGLMYGAPLLHDRFAFLPERFAIRESVSTTLAATFMTSPYVAFTFHRVSLLGTAVNIIVLPLVPFLMLFGAIAAAWGSMPMWQAVRLPALGLSSFIRWVARFSLDMPGAEMKTYAVDSILMLALYIFLFVFYRSFSHENSLSTCKKVAKDEFCKAKA